VSGEIEPCGVALPDPVLAELEQRLELLPADHIRNMADYFALRAIETTHISRRVRRMELSEDERATIEQWWLTQIRSRMSVELDLIFKSRWNRHHGGAIRHMQRRASAHRTHKIPEPLRRGSDQLRFNTFGPGGWTWMGNRYYSIRRYTFRLHWRP